MRLSYGRFRTRKAIGLVGQILSFFLITSCQTTKVINPEPFKLNDEQGRAIIEKFLQRMFSPEYNTSYEMIVFNYEIFIEFKGVPDSWIPDQIYGQKVIHLTENEYLRMLENRKGPVSAGEVHDFHLNLNSKKEKLSVFVVNYPFFLYRLNMEDFSEAGYPLLHFNCSSYSKLPGMFYKTTPSHLVTVIATPVEGIDDDVYLNWIYNENNPPDTKPPKYIPISSQIDKDVEFEGEE